MSKLTRETQRFFYRNRDKGLPNLMLYIAIINVVVYLLSMLNPAVPFYAFLSFSRASILQGQVWRLFTFVFTYLCEQSLFWGVISLFLYYYFGRMLEQYWGVLRFNCYYLLGVIIMDVAGLLLNMRADAYYLNLSIFLAVATLEPDAQVRIYFILPVKMKWMAWLDLGLMLLGVVRGLLYVAEGMFSFYWLFPLLAIANYFIFFGKQAANLLPDFLRYRPSRPKKAAYKGQTSRRPGNSGSYRFKCTVCGRTDTQNPGLEFRYCSQCVGFRCYCAEHINNHAHIR